MESRIASQAFTNASKFLIALILIVAPFPFGSVQDFWILAMELSICLLLFLWVAVQVAGGEVGLVKTRLTWPVLLMTAYLAVTALPITPRIVGALSSDTGFFYRKAADMARDLGAAVFSRFPLTLTPLETEGELFKVLCYTAFFFLMLNLLREGKAYIYLFRSIIATGAVVAALGLVQQVWTNGKIYWTYESGSGSPFGPFVSHNHFAGYMELALGLSLGMLLAEIRQFKEKSGFRGIAGYFAWILHKNGSAAWMLSVASLLMLVALMVSLSRGGVLSFGAACILFSLRALSFGSNVEAQTPPQARRRRNLRIIAGVGLAAILLIMAAMLTTPPARTRWSTIYDASLRFRLSIWNDAIQALSDFTLVGGGLGSFRSLFPRYLSAPFSSEVTHAENEYLQWAFETGFFGVVLGLAIVFAFIHQVIFRLSSRKDIKARCLGYGAAFSLISLSIHNAGDFNLHIPSNSLTFVAAAALCLLAINFHKGRHGDRFLLEIRRFRLRSPGGMLVIIAALGSAGVAAYRSWAHYQSLKYEQRWVVSNPFLPRTAPGEKELAALMEAQHWSDKNDRAYFLEASAYESAASAKGFLQLFKKDEMLSRAEQSLARAIQLRPIDAKYWAALGRIEMARQRYDLSDRAFQHALNLARLDAAIRRDYGIALIMAGNPQAAAAQFTIARNYAPSLPMMEMLEALATRTDDVRVWQSIVRYQPQDLRVYSDFLRSRGLVARADQLRAESEQLAKERPK